MTKRTDADRVPVATHKNPRLLTSTSILMALSCADCASPILVDRKCSMDELSYVNGMNLSLTQERLPVYWANSSLYRTFGANRWEHTHSLGGS